jgi:hypothetical protein
MTKRSPVAVLLLPIITCGISYIVWLVKTKNEMVEKGAEIPTAWLLIVPIANFIWLWKYAQGVEKVTSSALSGGAAFILMFLLGSIGGAVIQSKFNAV